MDLRKYGRYALAAFFILAGLNHFVNPGFYLPLIPKYFVYIETINFLSGIAEVILGTGLLFSATRRLSGYLIILLLLAFVPSHIYFIQIGSCVPGGLCVPEWVGWLRLLVVHPLLIGWAWWAR
jgi:uncharacterized membrane protein